MQFSWKPVGTVVSLWVGLMFLLFFHAFFGGREATFFLYSGYMVVASFSLTKFLEKQGIVERFGLQRNNAFGLLVVVCLGLGGAYYFDINNLLGFIFAPLFEETFFRGYMLGALCKHKEWEWRLTDLGWIVFTSLLYATANIFQHYAHMQTFSLSTWLHFWTIFLGSWSLGFLYLRLKTILWCFLVQILYNMGGPFGIASFRYLFIVFPLIIFSRYLLKCARAD